MSDLERYIQKREKKNPNFRAGLEEERRNLRIGLQIKELRLEKGHDAGTARAGDSHHQVSGPAT